MMEQINSIPNIPASPKTPTNPPIKSSFPNKTVLIILLIVFLIVLSSLITYLVVKSQPLPVSQSPTVSLAPLVQVSPTPTPDLTANWKTYTSTKNGFSFKIPSEFVVFEDVNVVKIFLNQTALDKSKVCKPDSKEIEPLPCSPALLEISYAETAKSNYTSGEEYVNKEHGGMGGKPYSIVQGQNLSWTVSKAAGMELRPTVRAFAYDNEKIRFVEINTNIIPFWNYTHKVSQQFSGLELNTLIKETNWQDIENLVSQILSTFKFLE